MRDTINDEEESNCYNCWKAGKDCGLTDEQIKLCDAGEYNCPNCPFKDNNLDTESGSKYPNWSCREDADNEIRQMNMELFSGKAPMNLMSMQAIQMATQMRDKIFPI